MIRGHWLPVKKFANIEEFPKRLPIPSVPSNKFTRRLPKTSETFT
jgi:hypothetical protein